MSVSSMMDVAYQQRQEVQPTGRGPRTLGETAQVTGENSETQSPVTAALESIMTYIPSEILVTYVAVVAVIHPTVAGETTNSAAADWIVFLVFLILSPVVSWLIYAAKCVNAGKALPGAVAQWPLWEMSAATIAYVIWAATLPETPFGGFSWYSPGLAAIVLLITSMLLGLIAPLIVRKPLPS